MREPCNKKLMLTMYLVLYIRTDISCIHIWPSIGLKAMFKSTSAKPTQNTADREVCAFSICMYCTQTPSADQRNICYMLNSLWPSDAIWWHKSGSTLAQVMAYCLTAPSHTGTNVDLSSIRLCGIHLSALWWEDLKKPSSKTSLKIAFYDHIQIPLGSMS